MAKYTGDDGNTITTKQFTAEVAEGIRALKSNLRDEILGEMGVQKVNRPNLGGATLARAQAKPGATFDGMSFGDFVKAASPAARQRGWTPEIRDAMSSIDPAGGGFLVPDAFLDDLLGLALETAVVRPRARVIPMSSASLSVPVVDATSNASSVFGGLTAVWSAESASLASDEPVFGRIRLEASKLTLTTYVPNELLQDSGPALDVILRSLFSEAIAWYEDSAFLTGNGVGQPLGVLNSPCLVTVTKEGGQTADTIVWENVVKMHSRMLPGSHGRAVWLAHPSCFPELATMSLSVGTGGSALWLQNGAASEPLTILGRPLIFTEKVPPIGGAGSGKDLSYVDFGYYLIGDRMQMSLEASPHARFTNDETVFRAILRCDARSSLLSAITPANGSDALSPVVVLGERG